MRARPVAVMRATATLTRRAADRAAHHACRPTQIGQMEPSEVAPSLVHRRESSIFHDVVECLRQVPNRARRIPIGAEDFRVDLLTPHNYRPVNRRCRLSRLSRIPQSASIRRLFPRHSHQYVQVQNTPVLPFPHKEELSGSPAIPQSTPRSIPQHTRVPIPCHLTRVVVPGRIQWNTPQARVARVVGCTASAPP